MLIRLENIEKSYPSVDLFKHVKLQVNSGDRIGLIGPNGSGKTQLLGIISCDVQPDKGTIHKRNDLVIGKLDQEITVDPSLTLLEETLKVFSELKKLEAHLRDLEHKISIASFSNDNSKDIMNRYGLLKEQFEYRGGYSYVSKTKAVLLGLGFQINQFDMRCSLLSGGQLSRVGLAKLLLTEADLLLLDEPTNHLDLEAIKWLEEYLKSWKGAYVVVSHDRFFLDTVVEKIWEITSKKVLTWPGNYSVYSKEKKLRLARQIKEFERQQEFIEKTRDYIQRNIYGQKSRQAKSRKKMLEKIEIKSAPVDRKREISIDFSEVKSSSQVVLSVSNLSVGYNCILVKFPFEFTFMRGDRVGILGKNGSGKTTFFKTIMGHIMPLEGTYSWGNNISVGYFDQKMESLKASPIEEMRMLAPLETDGQLRSFLALFGFRGDDVFKPLEVLSGGEKNRLLLARLIFARHNVLVMDEPTNHLDINSREVLEEALSRFSGTIFVVSHDRYFLDRIVKKIIFIGGEKALLFEGNYSEWLGYKRKRSNGTRKVKENVVQKKNHNKKHDRVGLSKNEIFRLEKELNAIEVEIEKWETRLKEIENILQSPNPSISHQQLEDLALEYEEINRRLHRLMIEWEEKGQLLNQSTG